jgi:Tfp pilus assembly protein PilF
MTKILTVLIAAGLAAGCAATSVRDTSLESNAPLRPAERALLAGIKQYEDGDLRTAEMTLQSALSQGLLYTPDKVAAHKYLAFIYCSTQREKPCRDAFATALKLDPSFQLSKAEAGHPMWGPVFQSVRTGAR